MEAWPASLPQVPIGDFKVEQSSGLLAPDAALGQIRTRTYPDRQASFTFKRLTAAQFQQFRYWWDTTLNQSGPFAAPWLALAGYTHHFCQFVASKPWELSVSGMGFVLKINVVIIAGVPVGAGGAIRYGEA